MLLYFWVSSVVLFYKYVVVVSFSVDGYYLYQYMYSYDYDIRDWLWVIEGISLNA